MARVRKKVEWGVPDHRTNDICGLTFQYRQAFLRRVGTVLGKILIIDDDDMFRRMLVDMLSQEGHQVSEAAEGTSGLERFRETAYDLIITDILMPGKEGIETIRKIRTSSKEVKIIALSGGGGHPEGLSYLEMARDLGADLSFSKPFRTSEFTRAVRDLLSA